MLLFLRKQRKHFIGINNVRNENINKLLNLKHSVKVSVEIGVFDDDDDEDYVFVCALCCGRR